ncbi:MAG TPA: hypothetical protein VFJ16_17375 [Longimicrobium sp.]|nr:hypothetical protein [Longimicrobium sp.]
MSAALAFAVAAAAGVAGTWAARRLAHRVGLVSRPNPIVPQHTRTVAYLGGVGVAAGMAAGAAASPRAWAGLPVAGLVIGAAAFLLLGLLDDARPLTPGQKLLLQTLAATLAAAGGVVCPVTGMDGLDAALAVAWMVTAVNAVNLIDVSDGLAAGVTGWALLGVAAAHPELRVPALAAAGAAAGFLVFNLPPATVFLGDAGAHLLGFVLAALALLGARGMPATDGAAAMLLVLGVPLFELCFVTVVRIRKGLPWWRGSPDHFALRLQAAGLTRLQAALAGWSAAAALAACAAALPHLGAGGRVGMGMAVAAALAAAWRMLLRWEVPPRPAAPPVAAPQG